MWLAEHFLYLLASRLYKTEVCHSTTMKEGLSDAEKYGEFRSSRAGSILGYARRFGVDVVGKSVLDFGCGDGALTRQYLGAGARRVFGVDIDDQAIARAQAKNDPAGLSFSVSTEDRIPLDDDSVDTGISFDVFEHVTRPSPILTELYRVVRPGGKVLIGTWGWYHPFAPHLFSAMPVPWAHVFFSEATIMRVCRRVYESPWYVPTMHDLDESGKKRPNRYLHDEIPLSYVNKLFIRDFERLFRGSKFQYRLFLVPFASRFASWTSVFLRSPFLREFVTAYLWIVLHKRESSGSSSEFERTAREQIASIGVDQSLPARTATF